MAKYGLIMIHLHPTEIDPRKKTLDTMKSEKMNIQRA